MSVAPDPMWDRLTRASRVHLREVKPSDLEWSMVIDDPRFITPTNPTVRVGDRIRVRNQAGRFFSNEAGRPMTWPVLSVRDGWVELAGKAHPQMIGNRWRTPRETCEVDLEARQRDLVNRYQHALVEVPGQDPSMATVLFTEHMPNVMLTDLIGRIRKEGIPVEVTSDRGRFVEHLTAQHDPLVAARRREERARQVSATSASPPQPGADAGRPAVRRMP
jgi:hypothetical protein